MTTKHAALSKKHSRGGCRAELDAVIDDIVIGNRILYDQGIVDGYGHVSGRDPRNPDKFLMSRARAPGLVVASDIMEFDLDGNAIRDRQQPVYLERFIHSEIYRARPDVRGIVHSHSPTVIPFGVTNTPLRPIIAPFLYPDVPVFDTRDVSGWTNLLISNSVLGKALAEKLGPNSVALLRGHGNVVVGATVRIAVYRAVYTEADAKLVLQAKTLGGPIKYLAPEEARIMEASLAHQRPGYGFDRIWELLKVEAIAHTGPLRLARTGR